MHFATGSFGIGFSAFLHSTSLMIRRKRSPRSIREVAMAGPVLEVNTSRAGSSLSPMESGQTLMPTLSIGNGRTNFQHMRLQNSFSAGHQIVCIIFHKGGSLCIPDPCCHDLHKTDHRGCLPVAFRSKSVAFFHQSLDCQSRKLLQSCPDHRNVSRLPDNYFLPGTVQSRSQYLPELPHDV